MWFLPNLKLAIYGLNHPQILGWWHWVYHMMYITRAATALVVLMRCLPPGASNASAEKSGDPGDPGIQQVAMENHHESLGKLQ